MKHDFEIGDAVALKDIREGGRDTGRILGFLPDGFGRVEWSTGVITNLHVFDLQRERK